LEVDFGDDLVPVIFYRTVRAGKVEAGTGCVGRWPEAQEPSRDLVDAICRNGIVRERLSGERIHDRAGEYPIPLIGRGHEPGKRPELPLPLTLPGKEEPSLVLAVE